MGDLSAHFSWWEFESSDGERMPTMARLAVERELVPALEILRETLRGVPLTIRSGYRSMEANRRAGGARKSQHRKGRAADIICPAGMTSDELAGIIGALIGLGAIPEGGIGLYHGRVHYDVRGKRARWDVR
jgi:uncharacterized protein YcbK (DUF882 family)